MILFLIFFFKDLVWLKKFFFSRVFLGCVAQEAPGELHMVVIRKFWLRAGFQRRSGQLVNHGSTVIGV